MGDDPTKQTALSPARKGPRRTGDDGGDEAPLSRATLVGRYVVLETLGEGGMGIVYKAFDPELDRKIALKLVRASDGSGSGGDHDRLLREAHAMAKLSHPNVVPIFDVGAFGKRVFLAMELVEGTTLRGWLEQEHDWREILDMFVAAGHGLAAAHAAGLIHRDFKPENVLIGNDGRARVTDFGLARAEHAESGDDEEMRGLRDSGPLAVELTAAGSIVGTPAYMAPEQIKAGTLGPRTDQFAYCVALFEALFGVRPFAGKGDERMAAIEAGTLRTGTTGQRVSGRVRRAVVRGLAADPEARHASMDALLAELVADRARSPWRSLAPVGALALAGAAVIAVVATRQASGPPACAAAGDRIAATWNPFIKVDLARRFVASGSPYARDAWAAAATNLDHYASAWSAMRVEACEATQVRKEQTEDVMTLRMMCLDQRHTEVRDLIEVLRSPDDTIVLKAPVASQQLVPVAGCADVESLQAPVPLPPSLLVRTEITALREQLAKARALRIAGKYDESFAIVEPLIPRVAVTSYKPLEAELDLALTKLYDYRGDARKSIDVAVLGYATAEAGNDHGLKADLAGEVVAAGANAGEIDLAKRYAALGLAVLDHLQDDTRRAQMYSSLGILYGIVPDLPACIRYTRDAIELLVRHDPSDINVIPAQINLANCLVVSTRFDEAIPVLEEALARTRKVFPNYDHPVTTAIYYNLGQIAAGRGDFLTAIKHFEQAHRIATETEGPDHRETIETEARIAGFHTDMGDAAGALAMLEPLFARYGDNKDNGVTVSVLLTIFGEALLNHGDLDRAEEIARRGLAHDMKLYGPEQNYDEDNLLIADVLAAKGDHAGALVHIRTAEAMERKLTGTPPVRCHLLISLGRVLLAQRAPAAVATLEEAVKIADTSAGIVPYWRGLARWSLARALGATPRAIELARKAQDEFGKAYARGTKPAQEIAAWLAANAH